jgi:chemotaxis protein MotB
VAEESAAGGRPIIIIKKKGGGHAGHHGGAWKVAFADFMTAMFALFLVLWILTQSQEVKSAIASYFRHPTDYEGRPDANLQGNDGMWENVQGRMDNRSNVFDTTNVKVELGGDGLSPESVNGGLVTKSSADPGLRPSIVERIEDQEKDEVRTFLKIADDLWMTLGTDPSFKRFKDNLAIQTLEDGLVVQIVDQPSSPLFEEGSREFKPALKKALAVLAQGLAKYPKNKLELSGHDGRVGSTNDSHGKWLASAQLAEETRSTLEQAGLKPNQITRVSGCADTRPLNPRSPDDPLNHRISILVRPRQWRPEHY